MTNLLKIFSNLSRKCWHSTPGIFRVMFISTQTQPSSSDTLSDRLHSCFDPQASIIPVLDKWVAQGQSIHHEELIRTIRDFRKRHRFRGALEIAEWMSDSKHFEIKPVDIALKLDLISKVHGMEQTESYFHSLDDNLKALPVYGSLLYCYADAKSLDKAEDIMENIRKLNFVSIINFNTMLRLYSLMGKWEKLDLLTQEMEARGFAYDEFSYSILLSAYGTSSDIVRMERLLRKMEIDPVVTINHHSYIAVAKGYIKAGDREKASVMLKKAEHLITGKVKSAYVVLLTVYASMQKKDDVYRLWNLHKNVGRFRNMDYLCMISSLEKLDDLDGAKKVLGEWEEKNISFDIRIPNLVIHALCKRGCLTEAEIIMKRLVETGKDLNPSTWSQMAFGYYKANSMEKAVEMTKKALFSSFPGWKPDLRVVAACLEYLKMKGDADRAKEILKLLEKSCHFSLDIKERLERYVLSGNPRAKTLESGML